MAFGQGFWRGIHVFKYILVSKLRFTDIHCEGKYICGEYIGYEMDINIRCKLEFASGAPAVVLTFTVIKMLERLFLRPWDQGHLHLE